MLLLMDQLLLKCYDKCYSKSSRHCCNYHVRLASTFEDGTVQDVAG